MKRLLIILFVVFYQFTFSQVTNNFVEGEVLLKVSTPFSQIYLQNGIIQTEQEWFNDISNNIVSYELKPVFENTEGDMEKFYVCRFPENYSVDNVIQTFKEEENVIHVWKNTIAEYLSNDPLFDQQWGLIKIQAPEAWNIESGNSNVILGIIDSGVDLGVPDDPPLDPHPDLEDNLWNINQMFGIDITNESRPPYDENGDGHGTKVSGIAGAVTNNSIGVAGTAGGGYNGDNGITILMIKADPPDEPNVSQAIVEAVNDSAKVINMSLGWEWRDDCDQSAHSPLPALEAAVNYAISNNVVLIAAIGNNRGDLTPRCPIVYWLFYPAAHPDVISVAGLGSDDVKASYSNYANWDDISAPSGHTSESGILSTFPIYLDTEPPIGYDDAGYGSSFAAPFVSGVAALIRSMAPDADVEMVRAILKQTTDNIDDVNEGFPWEDKIGTGRLNAFNALTLIQDLPDRPTGISAEYIGIHPLITWNKNEEADVKGYNVHAKYEFRNGPNPKNWTYNHADYFVTDTSFLDANWFREGNDRAYYYVQAIDIIDNWSFKSTTFWIAGGFGKQGTFDENLPDKYLLSAYPNPFNSQVTLKVDLPVTKDIILNIYNLQGQLIKQITKYNSAPGTHYFRWDGKNTFGIDVPSGIYFLITQNMPLLSTKKLILLK